MNELEIPTAIVKGGKAPFKILVEDRKFEDYAIACTAGILAAGGHGFGLAVGAAIAVGITIYATRRLTIVLLALKRAKPGKDEKCLTCGEDVDNGGYCEP